MKKLLSLICSLSLSATLLAGCSSTPQESSAPQTPVDPESPTSSQSVTAKAVDVKVMALKGPTAMGMVQFMSEADNGSITDNNYDFTITAMTDEVSAALAQVPQTLPQFRPIWLPSSIIIQRAASRSLRSIRWVYCTLSRVGIPYSPWRSSGQDHLCQRKRRHARICAELCADPERHRSHQ